MNIAQLYNDVNARLDLIDFASIWQGFHKYPFALYNDEVAVIDGKVIVKPQDFIANTSVEFDGKLIAIWNVNDFDGDVDILSANLVHEMFHCFQGDNGEERYPSDLDLLLYPDRAENFNLKYNENLLIADAIKNNNSCNLSKIIRCRTLRQEIIGDIIKQEFCAETVEGGAEFAGTMALRQLSQTKYQSRIDKYCAEISSLTKLQFDIRRISYYVGTLLLILYKTNCCNFDEFGDKTFFELANDVCSQSEFDVVQFNEIPQLLNSVLQYREEAISDFALAHPDFVAEPSFICGYDPMNMIRFGDWLLCNHFVFLNVNGTVKVADANRFCSV